MTPLRQRLIDDLRLRGYAERTVEAYVYAVHQLAQHYHTSPDQLTDEQLRQCFLHLLTERRVARSTLTIILCGVRFLYQHTLGRPWPLADVVRPRRPAKLPVVLSREEVWAILDAVRLPVYRVGLTTIYCCGLRLSEGAELQVTHIDGARAMLHITGKGGKDRYVPLPEATLALLRDHWRTHRNPAWLFPAGGPHGEIPRGTATTPINRSSLQSAFTRAVEQGGVRKRAHVHTLRHRYATHLLEAGVTLRLIQEYLGHTSVKTTAVYTHLTRELQATALEPINALMTRR